jgi:hypothetical protein
MRWRVEKRDEIEEEEEQLRSPGVGRFLPPSGRRRKR